MTSTFRKRSLLSLFSLVALIGCGDDDATTATLSLNIGAEDTITEGLGTSGDEAITDGWTVTFDKYIVALGDVRIEDAVSGEATNISGAYAVDLVQVPAAGFELFSVDAPVGRYEVFYSQLTMSDTQRDESVSDADFAAAAACSYWVEGTMEKADGRTCPPRADDIPDGAMVDADGCYANPSVSFAFCLDATVEYGPCELEEVSGVALTEGGSAAELTIHGDHLYFNGFPEGEEGGVMRLAQWMADCDLNLDGTVTEQELASIGIDDLAEIDARFELGGAPTIDEPLDDMWAYLRVQAITQGHFNGEGECPPNAR